MQASGLLELILLLMVAACYGKSIMAFFETNHVAIRGMSACVPKNVERNVDSYTKWGDYKKVRDIIGIDQRHVSPPNMCASDLFFEAGERLISDLGWSKSDIKAIVVVCQTPDYIQPPTACLLQHRLGLGEDCFATDVPHGCSGWIYGLSILSSLMQSGFIKKGLLFSGDTPTKCVSPEDKTTWPLFGDAGTCTALEYTRENSLFKFCCSTDGSGSGGIMIHDGGYRHPYNQDSLNMHVYGDGVKRNRNHLTMDGMTVFSFAISKAPEQVKQLMEFFKIEPEKIDYYLLHQANLFIDEKIRKKMRIPREKVLYCIQSFGNTSSGSIPLTLVSNAKSRLESAHLTLLGSGFGVGLSWASVLFETKNIKISDISEI